MKIIKIIVIVFAAVLTFGSAKAQVTVHARIGTRPVHHRHRVVVVHKRVVRHYYHHRVYRRPVHRHYYRHH